MPAQGPAPQILVTDDVRDIRDTLAAFLRRNGYRTRVAASAAEARKVLAETTIHLVLLDIMMPGESGLSLCRDLVAAKGPPVILLTAMTAGSDIVTGLNTGADDYVTKPFSPKELVLRVASVLKRCEHTPGSVIAEYGPFTFDKNALKFYIDKEEVDLTATEFKLMIHMVEREGQTLNRNDLLSCVWGYSHQAQSRTLDTHMKRLRQKLAPYADCIETVRSIGYRFTLPGRRIPEEKA